MMGVKDWVLSQLVSKSVVSSSQLSAGDRFSNDESLNGEFSNQGITFSPLDHTILQSTTFLGLRNAPIREGI